MKITRASLTILLALGTLCPPLALAQLDPGSYRGLQAVYRITDEAGETVGRVYVPGAGRPDWGQDVWQWKIAPWSRPFRLRRIGWVKARWLPGGWTEETYPGGALGAAAVPEEAVAYNWRVLDARGELVAYVLRKGTWLDWWAINPVPFLATDLTFEPAHGVVATKAIGAGLETDRLARRWGTASP